MCTTTVKGINLVISECRANEQDIMTKYPAFENLIYIFDEGNLHEVNKILFVNN